MSEDGKKEVLETAMAIGMDTRSYSIAIEVEKLLSSMKDEGTETDSGIGFGAADLWVTIGGVEYFVTIRPSNKQLLSEGVSRQELGLDP